MEHRGMIYTDNNFQGQRQKSRHKSLSQNALMQIGSSATDKLAKRIICQCTKIHMSIQCTSGNAGADVTSHIGNPVKHKNDKVDGRFHQAIGKSLRKKSLNNDAQYELESIVG